MRSCPVSGTKLRHAPLPEHEALIKVERMQDDWPSAHDHWGIYANKLETVLLVAIPSEKARIPAHPHARSHMHTLMHTRSGATWDDCCRVEAMSISCHSPAVKTEAYCVTQTQAYCAILTQAVITRTPTLRPASSSRHRTGMMTWCQQLVKHVSSAAQSMTHTKPW